MASSPFIRSLFILQIVPLILYPPATLAGGLPIIAVAAIAVAALGFMAIRGRPWALTMSIFIQGFNAIIRIMMFFPHAVSISTGTAVHGLAVHHHRVHLDSPVDLVPVPP